jgi:hypothetical protein
MRDAMETKNKWSEGKRKRKRREKGGEREGGG